MSAGAAQSKVAVVSADADALMADAIVAGSESACPCQKPQNGISALRCNQCIHLDVAFWLRRDAAVNADFSAASPYRSEVCSLTRFCSPFAARPDTPLFFKLGIHTFHHCLVAISFLRIQKSTFWQPVQEDFAPIPAEIRERLDRTRFSLSRYFHTITFSHLSFSHSPPWYCVACFSGASGDATRITRADLLPEIKHAYFSIDNELFLWNYSTYVDRPTDFLPQLFFTIWILNLVCAQFS